jgi:hypothetical protein
MVLLLSIGPWGVWPFSHGTEIRVVCLEMRGFGEFRDERLRLED